MNDKRSNNTWVIWALTLIFVALKLMKYITWSWIWVLSPLWIPVVLTIVIGVIGFIFSIGKHITNSEKENKKWMDPHENEALLHQMWTGEKDDD